MKQLALILALSTLAIAGCKEEQKPAENSPPPAAASTESSATPAASSESAPATTSESTPAAPATAASPAGTYQGKLPCASCEAIDTTLVLNTDGTYSLTTLFVGEANAQPETINGKYTQSDDGTLIRLDDAGFGYTYFIGDGMLEMRDTDGTTGERSAEESANYRLQKQ